MENFNVLLNLYKMNPLKKSQVYKSFLNGILLPNRGNSALNNDSNESVFTKTKPTLSVKQLENIINASNSNNNIKQPDFDIENINAEKFSIDNINNQIESSSRKEDFNSIFGHLESVEDDHIPVTKMLPVNNTNSIALLNTNEIDFDLPGDKNRNVDRVFSYVNATAENAAIQNFIVMNSVHKTRNSLTDNSVVVFRK